MGARSSAGDPGRANPRAYVEAAFLERSAHQTAESVQTTVSFARAERLLGREYHGRFLIELLQNAADAWGSRRDSGERSSVAVIIAEGPALIVANRGDEFPAKVVVESLGHIGRSTKPRGEAIGHKGIGFKSVLEVSLTPQIYSGLQTSPPRLAVRFDPQDALRAIRSRSSAWDVHLAEMADLAGADLEAVPTLRFPLWVETLPETVSELAQQGFDTAVVLPFDPRFSDRLDLTERGWLATVRQAMEGVSDEILVLLGVFDEVRIEDRLIGSTQLIAPHWAAATTLGARTTREVIEVRRDALVTSSWRVYRRAIAEARDLAAEVVVGLRIDDAGGVAQVVQANAAELSAPFHLFFPTRIGSGLPFLLHGYFEVSASRTEFYAGSALLNQLILDQLARLVADAIDHLAADGEIDLVSLVELLVRTPDPEDPAARRFKEATLCLLDDEEWVPVAPITGRQTRAKPTQVLSDARRSRLIKLAEGVFPPSYVLAKTGLRVGAPGLSEAGLAFLGSRRPNQSGEFWSQIARLLRPGQDSPWAAGEEDEGFRRLLNFIAALDGVDRSTTSQLLDDLRGDPESRLLPVVAADGSRTLLPLPDPVAGVSGRRSHLVMARVRGDSAVVPPEGLDVAFMPDGVLRDEGELDRAKALGVRPFTVDNVLDRLDLSPTDVREREELVSFLWTLLARERRSEFGTRVSAQKAASFDPELWFWLRPGRAEGAESDRDRQRRERNLAGVLLPARDGSWRPAGQLAFGADWARWLESGACGTASRALSLRIEAYGQLDLVLFDGAQMLAPPAEILGLLGDPPAPDLIETDDVDADAELDSEQMNSERHAFLLRLGVWEVIPVDGFESRATRGRTPVPWSGDDVDQQARTIENRGGWRFDGARWSGETHENVWVAEDYRIQCDLSAAARRDPVRLAQCLGRAVGLYRGLMRVAAFCPKCTDRGSRHTTTYRTAPYDQYPSILAVQLQTAHWVPTVRNGVEAPPSQPTHVWWTAELPAGSGLQQSPWRFLRMCAPAGQIGSELREIAGIRAVETADLDSLATLLKDLRQQSQSGELARLLESSSSKQSILAVHRLTYSRLAELALEDRAGVEALLEKTGVLCDVGGRYDYRGWTAARHDDGRFATYRRRFSGQLPFVVIAREKGLTAQRLGIAAFVTTTNRRGTEEGVDVTEELSDVVGRRASELLAIMVHHPLGSQTLDPASQQFKDRSERLANLRILQVEDLVLDVEVVGSAITITIGAGQDDDVFLDGPTTGHPRIFTDINGDRWEERFRRKVAPLLAVVLENPAYAATFSLFLQADSEHERETALQELGITQDDVDLIRSRLGALTDEDRASARRWFAAIITSRGGTAVDAGDHHSIHDALIEAGFDEGAAARLVELGGGDAVRRDDGPAGSLWLLASNGVDLSEVDRWLRTADKGDGLVISASRRRLHEWINRYGRLVAAVMALRIAPDEARRSALEWEAPPDQAFALDPPTRALVVPVIASLRSAGFAPDAERLAEEPEAELERLAGCAAGELGKYVDDLYGGEDRERILRALSMSWRRELLLLGVLARTSDSDTRAAIRNHAAIVDQELPLSPAMPSQLRPALTSLFPLHSTLASQLALLLVDSLSVGPPNAISLRRLAAANGLRIGLADIIDRALVSQTRDLIKHVRDRMKVLQKRSLTIAPPNELRTVPVAQEVPSKVDRKNVHRVQVDAGLDERKRHFGDEGEQFAFAAVVAALLALKPLELRRALADVDHLLSSGFFGGPVDQARAHVDRAGAINLDEEERIEELEALLRVSRYPGFGFDLIGWLPPGRGLGPTAMALEVKSSGDGTFHLSSNEWEVAGRCHSGLIPHPYGIVVVRRAAGGGVVRLDLLTDPVGLLAARELTMDPDGYKMSYKTTIA